jgi:hypothetical protein
VRARQRDRQVIGHNKLPAFQECAEDLLLSIDATCKSEARSIKLDGFGRNSGVPASFRYGGADRFDETRAPLRTFDMVRLAAETGSENVAGRIADYGLRRRLAAIDAEVQIPR